MRWSIWIDALSASLLPLIPRILKSIKMENSGLSNAVPTVAMPVGRTIPVSIVSFLKIERTSRTSDATLGRMEINGVGVCDTLENLGKEIAEGLYDAVIDMSPREGYLCPHIHVSDRDFAAGGDAGLRIHVLNLPCQSLGCIGVGTKDGDALDNSRVSFDRMMSMLPPPGVTFRVLIYGLH